MYVGGGGAVCTLTLSHSKPTHQPQECTPPATNNGNGNNGNTANGASPFPLHEDKGLLQQWETIASTVEDPALPPVRIAVVGKYTGLRDSYLSIEKALQVRKRAGGA